MRHNYDFTLSCKSVLNVASACLARAAFVLVTLGSVLLPSPAALVSLTADASSIGVLSPSARFVKGLDFFFRCKLEHVVVRGFIDEIQISLVATRFPLIASNTIFTKLSHERGGEAMDWMSSPNCFFTHD